MISNGSINRFIDDDVDLMAHMTLLVKAALNWNVLSISSDEEEKLES
jgi:hypothetical protein